MTKIKVKPHPHKHERTILGGRRVVFFTDEFGERKRRLEKSGGYEVFRCVFPGCRHYLPIELALGQPSICWKCGEDLILTVDNLRLKHPTHVTCRGRRVLA